MRDDCPAHAAELRVAPTPPARRPMLLTLIVASALSPLAINIFLPSMASIAQDLQASSGQIGLGLSLFLAATAIIQLVAGPLSDRYGRRPIILAGMALFLVGTLMCIFAGDAAMFLAGRVVQAASATGIVLSRAIVRDLYARDQAASMLGYVTMGFAVAPMFGPAIGGLLDDAFGWRAVFWMLGGIGVLTLGLLAFDLSETNKARGAPMGAQFRSYGLLLRTPAFWKFTGVAAFVSAAFFAFLGGAPFIAAQALGMTPAEYGLWFMLCALGYIAGNFITGRFSQRLGLKRMMIVGSAITGSASALMLILFLGGWISPLTLFGPMMLVGFGNGLSVPTATASSVSVRPEAAGAAAGLLGAFQIGTGAVFSVTAAAFAYTPAITALLMVVGGAIAVACALRAGRVEIS
ncbi:multidrug effflux MFS transporter [Aureimonas mangrovi]|uniref:multidrug effflux MFS transporter n=1 Tax=Aureimonas mangrovi TaxID=2758041 RepID=UPI001FE6DB5F|nr:multidrug effflux MFS transporter [Aureimonas mangrovi]